MQIFNFIKKILLIPFLFFVVGVVLYILSTFQHRFHQHLIQKVLGISAIVGLIMIVFSGLLFFYRLIAFLCRQYEKQALNKGYKITSLIVSIVRRSAVIIFLLVALRFVVLFVGFSSFYLNIANKVIDAILISFIGWIGLQILQTIESVSYQYSISSTGVQIKKSKAVYTKIHIIRNIIAAIIVIITIAAILMLFDTFRHIGISLLASAGLLTAIVGLASQKTLSSLFSGFQLALTQAVKLDDIVVVENEYGTVESISLTHVVVKIWDMRRIVLPISYFLEKPFQNWSLTGDKLLGTVFLYVDHTLPVQPVREALQKIVAESKYWDKDACQLQVTDCKEYYIELRVLLSSTNPDDLYALRTEVREKLIVFIAKHYPSSLPTRRTLTSKGD